MSKFIYLIYLKLLFIPVCSGVVIAQNTSPSARIQVADAVMPKNVNQKFKLPIIPLTLKDTEQRNEYLLNHYWDNFDFSNSELIHQPDITEQALVDFIDTINRIAKRKAISYIALSLEDASKDPKMYRHIIELYNKYLNQPNSPFRNEELYIQILENISAGTHLNDAEKAQYRFELMMKRKNSVGHKATNFNYSLACGSTKQMHDIKTEYLILLFSDPDCGICKTTIASIKNSSILKKLFKKNTTENSRLSLLSIYPENDLAIWQSSLNEFSNDWINAYDKEEMITKKQLYDLKALPSFYLLDKNKNVLLKDCSLNDIVLFLNKNILNK